MKDEAKYNAALERAKERYSSCSDPALLEHIFPELKENEGVRISKAIINYIKYGLHCGVSDADMIVWLEKQRDYIKLSNSTYTSNRDIIEFADKYSHTIWENLMDNFKKIENYSIGCNDVSDIVLNAIINTYNWLEKQKDVSSIERVFRPIAGCDIADAAMQAIEQQQLGYKIVLAFNGAYIRVEEKTADDIVNEYYSWLKKQGEKYSPIDINKMVDEFAHTEVKGYGIPCMIEVDAYRKGIEDTLKKQSDNDSQIVLPTFTFNDILALHCCMEIVTKVRELMIGDYVRYSCVNAKIIRIGLFTQAEIMDSNHDVYSVFTKDLVSIPLTTEILEKNGFWREHNVGYVMEENENEIIYSLWDHKLQILKNGEQILNLKYLDEMCVHELQHALLLCGIDKEIEL